MPLFYAEKILFQISGAESSTFFQPKKRLSEGAKKGLFLTP
jgi:hypothetical protein